MLNSGPTFELEPLEDRRMMTTYSPGSVSDLLKLEPVLGVITPPTSSSRFGASVVSLGDVDGDGVPDFSVGAPGHSASEGDGSVVMGAVYIFSSKTRAVIRTLNDGQPGFGTTLESMGDLDHDGVNDIAVGNPRYVKFASGIAGRVGVYSSKTGGLLYELIGPSGAGKFARSLARVRDLDADGVEDLAVGDEGTVRLYSGAAGAELFVLTSPNLEPSFGFAIARIDSFDVNATHQGPFIAIGAPDDQGGAVFRYSRNQSLVTNGLTRGTGRFGYSLASFGEYGNSISVPMLSVGAPDDSGSGPGTGSVHVIVAGVVGPQQYSATESVVYSSTAGESLGSWLYTIDDWAGSSALTSSRTVRDFAIVVRRSDGSAWVDVQALQGDVGHGGFIIFIQFRLSITRAHHFRLEQRARSEISTATAFPI